MTARREHTPSIAIDVPWSDQLTDYDYAHLTTYLRILDALDDDASVEEMARIILDLDPSRDPMTAQRAVLSHARRAIWLTEHWYLLLRRERPTIRIH
jgi:hypothetical protein